MLNLTLVVQAGNFLIAYAMIRILLLRPAVKCIHEDDKAYTNALEKIETQKERLRIQEEQIQNRGKNFQQTFLENEPAIIEAEEIKVIIVPGMPELPAIDEKEASRLAKETADQLIEKVAHVQ